MKNKKLYVGTIALALSIGAIAPLGNNAISSVAYASQIGEESQNNNDLQSLKLLVDEEDNVHKSASYNNSSKTEKANYDNAVKAAASANEQTTATEIQEYIKKINDAKASLGANSISTYEQREGLSSTIAIAEKLSNVIANNSNVSKADKDKLANAINSAKSDENNLEIDADEINSANKTLAQTINDVISDNNLDANNSSLSNEEIEKITPSNNAIYGKTFKKLGNLINEVREFSETTDYSKLSPQNTVELTNASTSAKEVFENKNSTEEQLNTAYKKLNEAYNDALTVVNSQNTKASRLIVSIKNETANKPSGYDKAGKTAQLTYDIAKARANELISKNSTNEDDLEKALNNLNLAKLALAPVETKTIDQNPSQKTPKENLNDLINGADDYREKDPYRSASDAAKKAYDDAITTAKNIYNNNNSTDAQYNAAIQTIKEAQNKLANPVNEDQKIYELAKNILHDFVNNKDQVTKNSVYTNADADKKTAYDNAIADANKLLVKIANGESVSLDQLHENIIKVGNALTDLGYKEELKYPSTLKELIDEAPSFRQSYAYYLNNNSEKDADKVLIKTYEDLIKGASDYIASGKNDQAVLDRYVERINNLKKAIINNISMAELSLRSYVTSSPLVEASDNFKKALESDNPVIKQATEDFKELIIEAKAHLTSTDRTDESMNAYVKKIENVLALIDNQTDENAYKYQLAKLVDDAQKVKKHPDYTKVAQQYRDNLTMALDKAEKAETLDQIKSAISDLDTALRIEDFQNLLKNSVREDNKESLEDLLDLAIRVKEHNEYKNVGFTQRGNLDKAITAAKATLVNKTETEIEIARTGLVNALNQNEIKPIVDLIKANIKDNEPAYVKELKDIVELANKVIKHPDYANVRESTKTWLENEIIDAEAALRDGDKESIIFEIDFLKKILNNEELKPIVKKIQESEASNQTVNPREIIKKMIDNDETLKSSEKYKKSQKSLKEVYDKALAEASALINDENAKEEDLKAASDKLIEAANALNGDKFKARLKELQEDFALNKYDIKDKAKRSEIEEKIKALDRDNATMDDLLAVEKEYKNVNAVTGTSTPIATTTKTTQVPTTTTTPVTTTRQVPATINPGSIVRTGIKSLVGVAALLVVALGAFALTSKNKDKNEKTKRRENNEIK